MECAKALQNRRANRASLKSWFTCALIAVSSGCSLKNSNATTLTITLPPSPGTHGRAHAALTGPVGRDTPPADLSGFACYGVAVSAPDIAPDARLDCANPSDAPGILAGLVAAGAAGSTISITVPTGSGRLVRVVGMTNTAATCPDIQTLLNSTDPNRFRTLGSPYLLASTTADISADLSVTLSLTYSAATATPLFSNCANAGPSPTPTSSPTTPAGSSLVFTSPATASVGTAGIPFSQTPSVQALDPTGAAVADFTGPVTLALYRDALCVASPLPASALTYAAGNIVNGNESFNLFTVNLAGNIYLQGSVPGYQSACTPLQVSPGALSIYNSTVVASLSSVAASGVADDTIVVTLMDSFGDPLPGITVSLSASPNSGVGISPSGATSNAAGVATFQISASSPSSVTFTAYAGGSTLMNEATIQFTTAVTAPGAIIYTSPNGVYLIDSPISYNIPSNSGGTITSYSVTPALPTGLSLDPVTGQISGTPTVLSGPASYTVTGTNSAGTSPGTTLTIAVNGDPTLARFNHPSSAVADNMGDLFVVDTNNSSIRKITANGVVTTFAGTPGSAGHQDGSGTSAQFSNPTSIAIDTSTNNLYVTDTGNLTIRQITPAGVVTTFAGSFGMQGSADGAPGAGTFGQPFGIAIDGSENLYVTDSTNSTIRKVDPAGNLSTFAGVAGTQGSTDGTGPGALFFKPLGIAVAPDGNMYVADANNQNIRMITPAGVVSTIAGTTGTSGNSNGSGSAATFSSPIGLAVDNTNTYLYVADSGNNEIRVVLLNAPYNVNTFAGSGTAGGQDAAGTTAEFNSPQGLAFDGSGSILYVADVLNDTIRAITTAQNVTTFAGALGQPGALNEP